MIPRRLPGDYGVLFFIRKKTKKDKGDLLQVFSVPGWKEKKGLLTSKEITKLGEEGKGYRCEGRCVKPKSESVKQHWGIGVLKGGGPT